MSATTKAKDNSKWIAFAERHRNQSYSIAYNGFLDSLIADENAPLFTRVVFWLIRNAWGNFSDWPIDFKTGVMKKQVDCARDLKLKDSKGEADRRKVNTVFRELEDLGYIRFDQQAIILIDDPKEASFASSSNKGDPYPTNSGKLPSFQSYIEEVWASSHPAEFTEYQKTEQRYKELRTSILSAFHAFKEALSDRGATNGEARPEGERHDVVEGSDVASATDTTTEPRILIGSKPLENVVSTSPSSSVSSLVGAALRQYANIDDDVPKQLIEACRKNAPDCTAEEIAHFVHQKAKLITKRTTNPAGLLLMAVPKCFVGESFAEYRKEQAQAPETQELTTAERIAVLEDLVTMTEHPQVAEFRKELEKLKGNKAKGASA